MQESIVRRSDNKAPGLLSRLRHDTTGNALAMIAMATIPLVGMVGSAVDIGRSYLIKSRLQQGCDAGVLAARRAMTGSTLDGAATTQGQNFFRTNFANNTGGAVNVSFTPTGTADGQVTGTANARVPMSITKVFGTEYVDLSVQCDARLEISNTDVMMVLDVTGSMACRPDDSDCDSGPESKIVALRSATVNFFDTIENATNADARFRIGFVPYSSAVNMGQDPFTSTNLLPANWLVDNWTYQSRVANMTKPGFSPTTTYGGWTNQNYGSSITNDDCSKYGQNNSFSGFSPSPEGNPIIPTNDVFAPSQPANVAQTQYERVTPAPYSNKKTCTRRYRTATTSYAENGRFSFTSWDFKPVTYNVAGYKTGAIVSAYISNNAPTGSVIGSGAYNMVELVNDPGSTVTASSTAYEGCLEERDTFAQATYTSIPSTAYDMDILTTPSSDATRWRPMWKELIFDRAGVANELNTMTNRPRVTLAWCPAEASHLADRTRTDVQDYVDSLVATGNTFHDLGMAWGARMLSPTGMWAAQNSTAPNGRAITRHLIFMTDGDMYTPPDIYNAHGYEKLDRRISGGAAPTLSDLINRRNSRFVAMCNAARANNIIIWTVAFGTSNPPNLLACADPGRAFQATNAAALQTQFQTIASQIAALRISR